MLSVISLVAFLEAALDWTVPNPPAILSMIIVFAAFRGGLWSSMIAALISCVYFALYFSKDGMPFHYNADNLLRVVVYAVTTPTVAVMASIAKHRASRGAQERLAMEREGLLLCFSTRLSALDKLLVEGIIVGVLGRETDCYVAEYRVQGDTAIVRLCGSRRADLERVAEALYLRVWEQVHVHQMALVRIVDALQPSTLKAGLDDLFGQRLARMELREPAPTVADPGPSAQAFDGAWASPAPRPAPLRWAWHRPGLPGEDRIFTEARPRRIFLCHAPDDLKHARALCTHLSVIHRQGLIETFRAEDMLPGSTVADALAASLDQSDIVLCLVSASFLAHEGCADQVDRALRRRSRSRAPIVVPVLVRPSDWRESPLGVLQPLPENGQPITAWGSEDEAWSSVTSGLRRLLLAG
ncbi:TIR domain-containing protein [Sorangium sp. So ce145]|uniref:TIR domain-containing protein n=1 Tax=Sorangium sp. So ce145 TaxID=3133285 RepID=UPI003F63A12B